MNSSEKQDQRLEHIVETISFRVIPEIKRIRRSYKTVVTLQVIEICLIVIILGTILSMVGT